MKTCLIVDDNCSIRAAAKSLIMSLGLDFDIFEAEHGQKALEICKVRFPEVILLDWNMPVLDGHGFLVELRKLADGDKPKVIVCTAEDSVAIRTRALHAGADECLLKPFDADALLQKLSEVGVI